MALKNLLEPRSLGPERRLEIEADLRDRLVQTKPRTSRFRLASRRTGAFVVAAAIGVGGVGVAAAAQFGALPWVGTPGSSTPPPLTVVKLPAAPPCSAASLQVTNLNWRWQYTGGGNGAVFSVRNTSPHACRVAGYLPISLDGKAVVHGSNFLGVAPANLAPRATANFALVQDYPQTRAVVACTQRRLPLLRETVALAGRNVAEASLNRCFDVWMTPVGVTVSVIPTVAADAIGHLTASVDLPGKVVAGQEVHFTITLTNPTSTTVHLSPCPSYKVGIYPGTTLVYLLNCAAESIGPKMSQTYEMQYPVSAVAGPAKFAWMLVNQMPVAVARQVTVTHEP